MAASEDIDLDSIAAFMDGRLGGAERERVLALLSASEAAFEIYADAVRARAELGADDSVVPLPVSQNTPRSGGTRRWWITAVPLAAAAAVTIAILPKMKSGSQPTALDLPAESIVVAMTSSSTARPALPLVGHPTAGPGTTLVTALQGAREDEARWVLRGGTNALVDSSAAVRLGVHATHLRVALAVGEREHARNIAGEMVDLLRPIGASEAAQADYSQIRDRIAAGDSINQISDAASRADQDLSDLLSSSWFGLGKWFAAGELAARTRSQSFFASNRTKDFLKSTIASGSLAPEDVALLRQVAALGPGLSDADFERIRGVFAELIRRHGG